MPSRERFVVSQGEEKAIQVVGKIFSEYCAAATPKDDLPALRGDIRDFLRRMPGGLKYIQAYTEDAIFAEINRALRDDSPSLKDLAEYVWMLREQLRHLATQYGWHVGLVYRGIRGVNASDFHVGQAGKFPSFTSTSQNRDIAEGWISTSAGVVLIITLRDGCGASIENISKYPGEQEVLLRPYCNYTVTKIEGKKVYMNVSPP